MGSAAVLAHVGTPTKKVADTWQTNLEVMFPEAFGDWRLDRSMPIILPSPDVQSVLDAIYNQVLSRTYINQHTRSRIMLSVAYGGDQSDGMRIHLPEVCYPAQGFQVLSRETGQVNTKNRDIDVIRLKTKLGGRYEPVTYWITVGESVVPSRTQQKLEQMRYGLKGQIPDGMLIRVSSIDSSADEAFTSQNTFIRDLASYVSGKPYESRVFGRART